MNSLPLLPLQMPTSAFKRFNKFWYWTKLKALADDKLNNAKMIFSLFGRIENIEEKGKNARSQRFLLFPTMFSKDLFRRVVKTRDCMVKSLFEQSESEITSDWLHGMI